MAILDVQCAVVGDGPAGLATATALARGGLDVAAVGPAAAWTGSESGHSETGHDAARPRDPRTAALFPPSIAFLDHIGAWRHLRAECAPLRSIRIVDMTGSLLRAPEVVFDPSEIGWPAFGLNVPQDPLARALDTAAAAAGVRRIATRAVERIDAGADAATLVTAEGLNIKAQLVVGADGRDSICRAAAGIEVERWSYPQTAIATRFRHSRPHRDISTELHSSAGPCTTVPLPGLASSLVWVERPDEARRLCELSDTAFIAALELRLDGLLGTLCEPAARRAFPLSGLSVRTMARNRICLVGEAAHVIPPIGAQGLNLGLLDAAVLAEVVGRASASGGDIAGSTVLEAYSSTRLADVRRRAGAVDVVNRMLISGLLPLSLARGLGLHAIAAAGPLRRRMMREGLEAPPPAPRSMAGAAELIRRELSTEPLPLHRGA